MNSCFFPILNKTSCDECETILERHKKHLEYDHRCVLCKHNMNNLDLNDTINYIHNLNELPINMKRKHFMCNKLCDSGSQFCQSHFGLATICLLGFKDILYLKYLPNHYDETLDHFVYSKL